MISIVIPVYNVAKYLDKCLQSVLNQTYKDFEVILVNDGATDNSLEICKKYEKLDERVIVFSQENGGLSAARNSGIKLAKREYITFIDSDDWVEPTLIETLYKTIIKHNADISICEFCYDIESQDRILYRKYKNKKETVYTSKKATSILLSDKYIQNFAWGKLYKTSLFDNYEFPVGKYFEDIFLMYKLFVAVNKIVKKDSIEYHYVQHANSISSSKNTDFKKDLDCYEGLYEQAKYVVENREKVANPNSTLIDIGVKIYRHKKRIILDRKEVSSPEFLALDKEFKKGMELVLKETKFFFLRKGLSYIKYLYAHKNPELFLKYLNIDKRRGRIKYTYHIKRSILELKANGLILYPTDTVYGIGCDATSKEAVEKVYRLKNRKEEKSLIVLVSSLNMLKKYVSVPKKAIEIINSSEEPTTIIYKNPKKLASNLINKTDNSVAIRVVNDTFCKKLINKFNKPIVSTSANVSGSKTPQYLSEVDPEIINGVNFVVNFETIEEPVKPSKILKIEGDTVTVIRE